jgi:tetratricopeptide (TPR) repeat protein
VGDDAGRVLESQVILVTNLGFSPFLLKILRLLQGAIDFKNLSLSWLADGGRMGRTGLFPYYYGEHRWDNHLLDIQDAVEQNSDLLREQTEELQEQTEELRRQTEEMSNIRIGIERMREEMHWGFMLVADRMDRQIEQFSKALQKLEAIHKTLQSPLMTQAKELFEVGEQRLNQGLLDKALEAYLQSEQKNEVNFLLQRRIGMLFLEGVSRECDVIDFAQAEKHLLLAARYAHAAEKTEPDWPWFCAEAYYRAGNAAYLAGEQKFKAGDLDGMRACLERSLQHLGKAVAVRPELTPCLYSQAKCYALLGQDDAALERFNVLVDRNRNHSEVLKDKDFDRMRSSIEQVFRSALEDPGPLARSTEKNLDKANEAMTWAHRVQSNVTTFESYLSNARRLLRGLDVNIEVLSQELTQTRHKLEMMAEEALRSRVNALKSEIGSVVSRRSQSEQSIQTLQKAQALNKGGEGLGCLFVIGMCLVLYYVITLAPADTDNIIISVIVVFILAVIPASYFVGRRISRQRRKRPFQRELEKKILEMAEIDGRLSALRQSLEAQQKEMEEFDAWRATAAP